MNDKPNATVKDEHRTIVVVKGRNNRFVALIGGIELSAESAAEAERKAIEYVLADPLLANALRDVEARARRIEHQSKPEGLGFQ